VLPRSVESWRDQGFFFEVSGRRHFGIDSGPNDADECVLVLHGFPSSSYDFRLVWDDLRGRGASPRRVLAFDAAGFGLSDKPPEAPYSLFDVADVAEVLLRERGVTRAHVVAHDMGTSVLAELIARRERGLLTFALESVLFTNGSVFVEMTKLTRSQKLLLSPLADTFAKLSRFGLFKAQLDRILGRPFADPEEYEAMYQLIRHLDGHLRLPQTIGYVRERRRYRTRWIPPLGRLDVPARVLWGPLDGVAVMPIGDRLARTIPGASLVRLEGLGHYPMLEDPVATGRALGEWLDACFGGGA
jgi:pimeloyl-ACP methyl ester carboxylesterase